MKRVDFEKKDDKLILFYETDHSWIEEKLDSNETIEVYKTFSFRKGDLIERIDESGFTYKFLLGVKVGDYYCISKDKLSTSFDLYIDCTLPIDWSWFVTTSNKRIRYTNNNGKEEYSSIYGNILYAFNDFYKGDKLYFDVDSEQAFTDDGYHLTISTYKEFLNAFPTATNARYQKLSIFTNILKNELDVDDYEAVYQEYKRKHIPVASSKTFLTQTLREQEKQKFMYAKAQLEKALDDYNKGKFIHEDDFSKYVAEFFCLLNPKYIMVSTKLNIIDYTQARTSCHADLVLIDCEGNIDLIEVKSPKYSNLFRKRPYRSHYVACGELSGAINQLEQYLKSLTKMSSNEIADNNSDLQKKLGCIALKAVHPKGYIIFGRDAESFTGENIDQKKCDYEIIRNTYRDVVDVITFDELIRRFDNIIKFI